MDRPPPERCVCCRRLFTGWHFTIGLPDGRTERVCRSCGPHVTLAPTGTIEYPSVCPLTVRPVGMRLV